MTQSKTKKLTQERLEAIRNRAEQISEGRLITNMDVIPSIGKMAREDIPMLLAEIERLREIICGIPSEVRNLTGDYNDYGANQIEEYIAEVIRNDREEA